VFLALQYVRIIVRREDFGVRWQSDSPRRSEAKTGAATPLFDCGQNFQSGVAPALRDSRRTPKGFGCGYAALCSLRLKIEASWNSALRNSCEFAQFA
jgi:hypothetical protein